MKNLLVSPTTGLRSRQRGMTLVEWMVSITIGLFLLAGLAVLFQHQSNSNYELEKSGRQIENGRYAMQLLRDDIELAGYWGEYAPSTGVTMSVPADSCNPTATNQGWSSATPLSVPVSVNGYDDSTAASLSCLSNRKSGTAILVTRRVDTTASGEDGTLHLQVSLCDSDASRFIFGNSGFILLKKNCAANNFAALRKYVVRIYYISTCSKCSGTDADTIPTLRVVENGTNYPLVEGIEDLRIDYGIDTTMDGAPDSFTAGSAAVTDWSNVMALRVHLLARNNEPTGGYTDTKTYTINPLGVPATVGPFSDAFKRHVFSQLIRVVNPSSRRDQ